MFSIGNKMQLSHFWKNCFLKFSMKLFFQFSFILKKFQNKDYDYGFDQQLLP